MDRASVVVLFAESGREFAEQTVRGLIREYGVPLNILRFEPPDSAIIGVPDGTYEIFIAKFREHPGIRHTNYNWGGIRS